MKVYWERKGDEKTGSPKIVYDGIPFVYMGEKILWCHQGKDKYKNSEDGEKCPGKEKCWEILKSLFTWQMCFFCGVP